ncbi:hypothetical protein V3C99_011957 [Haemonchus contortus]|uniref:Transposase n=1 Tax=Haemonchus contortus TaxID=6289 RepID=A0A7I4Y6L3_HAECO
MLGISLSVKAQKEIRSTGLRRRTKIRNAVDYEKSKIRRDVMRYSDDRWIWAIADWIPGTLNEHQNDLRPDGQTSSRKLRSLRASTIH